MKPEETRGIAMIDAEEEGAWFKGGTMVDP
jgi:hypothetical protein